MEFDERELSSGSTIRHSTVTASSSTLDTAAVSAHLRAERETKIRLTLNRGSGSIRFWTCDLTAEYVRLNADYTT